MANVLTNSSNGEWWVRDMCTGKVYPKRPEYREWCQAEECLALKSFVCHLRHRYQTDYWVRKGFNLEQLDRDPERRGSLNPPSQHEDTRFYPVNRDARYTGYMRGAATGRDFANNKAGSRRGLR